MSESEPGGVPAEAMTASMPIAFARFARNWPRARRAGLVAFALAQLLVSSAATAWLSAHSAVAHAHPLGTGDHVHALDEVFAVGSVAAPVHRVEVSLGATQERVPTLELHTPASTWPRPHEARAPPALA